MTRDFRADLFGTAYLAAHHDEPLNTREVRFQSLAIFRMAAILGGIDRPEQRLSYETGLTPPELRAIDLLIRHRHSNLYGLVAKKAQGADYTNLEAALFYVNEISYVEFACQKKRTNGLTKTLSRRRSDLTKLSSPKESACGRSRQSFLGDGNHFSLVRKKVDTRKSLHRSLRKTPLPAPFLH